jgi:hypothetical protein
VWLQFEQAFVEIVQTAKTHNVSTLRLLTHWWPSGMADLIDRCARSTACCT